MASEPCDDATELVVPGDADAVHKALHSLGQSLLFAKLDPDLRQNAEIVLAEVLNNIVEHAYAQKTGDIRLLLTMQPHGVFCQVTDHGVPMPGMCLPTGAFQALGETEDLPEGGFGWFLIRSLTDVLEYQHSDGENSLSFRLIGKQSAS